MSRLQNEFFLFHSLSHVIFLFLVFVQATFIVIAILANRTRVRRFTGMYS